MIGIIDYGAGNLRSVLNAFSFVGASASVVDRGEQVRGCDRLVLPGVGAFGDAMEKLRARGLDGAILDFIKTGRPFLGVCLGMQLLFKKSYEFGEHAGLGVLDGEVVRFSGVGAGGFEGGELGAGSEDGGELGDGAGSGGGLKIPHVGWNQCKIRQNSAILRGINDNFYLYFVHSYHIKCDKNIVLTTTKYGYEFASSVAKDNIFAFQPHPEKSHENGLKIIKNFTEL